MAIYESPGHWFYQVNVNGKFLGTNVKSEREIPEHVGRILKGTGGAVSQSP